MSEDCWPNNIRPHLSVKPFTNIHHCDYQYCHNCKTVQLLW